MTGQSHAAARRFEERIRAFVSGSAPCEWICKESAALGIKPFLIGGALRDLYYGSDPTNDLDFAFEGSKAHVDELDTRVRAAFPAESRLIELRAWPKIDYFLLETDFTIHAALFDLSAQKLQVSEAALSDLERRVIRHLSPTFYMTAPEQFIRMSRLKLALGGMIAADTKAFTKKFACMLSSLLPSSKETAYKQLLKLLSIRELGDGLAEMFELGTLPALIKELHLAENACINGTDVTFLSYNLAMIQEAEACLRSAPERLVRSLLDGGDLPWNRLGALRLSALLSSIGEACLRLDASLPALFQTAEYEYFANKQLLNGILAGLERNPPLFQEISRMVDRGIISRTLAREALLSHADQLHSAYDAIESAAHRTDALFFACMHLAASRRVGISAPAATEAALARLFALNGSAGS